MMMSPRPKGSIILLHGASSSGKSTLGRAMQACADRPFWCLSIDVLRDHGVVPMERFRSREFNWKAARPAFFDGFHASLAAYAGAGNDLIVEHIFEQPDWLTALAHQLAGFDVFFVGVHCPLKELERREALRGDRPIGSARKDLERVHLGVIYDFEIETIGNVKANAEWVLEAWCNRQHPSAFARLAGVVQP